MSEELEKMILELSVEEIIEKYNIEEMISELEEDAETAGFADYYERVLKGMTEEEVVEAFKQMILSCKKTMEEMQQMKNNY